MAIQIVDGFGEWDDLGTVQPVFEDWLTFPDFTNSSSTLLRLTYLFEEFDYNSYGFIRCKYEAQNTFAIGRWLRFYPKFEDEFIRYPHSEDLLTLKGDFKRIYQVMKRHRRRRYNGTFAATLWAVNLNVCNEQVSNSPDNNEELLELLNDIKDCACSDSEGENGLPSNSPQENNSSQTTLDGSPIDLEFL